MVSHRAFSLGLLLFVLYLVIFLAPLNYCIPHYFLMIPMFFVCHKSLDVLIETLNNELKLVRKERGFVITDYP